MEHDRVAPLVGILGCLAVLAALAYPYFAVPADVGAYYAAGALNPLAAGALALVTIIVLAAGRERRTEPDFAAGVALVFGLAIVVILALWATSVRLDVAAVHPDHRWVATGVSLLVPAGSAWFARSLGVL